MTSSILVVFGAAALAFLGALGALAGVRGTCAGSCERLGRIACEGCPHGAARRRAAAEETGDGPPS